MKIDIFCHIVPQNYYDRMMKLPESGTTIKKRTANIPAMVDLDARFRFMDRFPGFVGALPMNNPAAAVEEIDRAVLKLGAVGFQIYSNVNGRPLDEPEFLPIFQKIAERNVPLW